MAITRQVISTLRPDGTELLGTKILAHKIPDNAIVSGSLLTVESNNICVVKSRGVVLSTYTAGQYSLTTPDKPIIGNFVQGFFNGTSPWQYEVIYINCAKLLVSNQGIATSREMAEVSYSVDYYIHVDDAKGALELITHMPFDRHDINVDEIAAYAGPCIEQAINEVVQVTKMEEINLNIRKLLEIVKGHLADFLKVYGITLNDLKVLVVPKDARMRQLISLQAIGLSADAAVRYYLALQMADKGLVSAPNAANGTSFNINGVMPTMPLTDIVGRLTIGER